MSLDDLGSSTNVDRFQYESVALAAGPSMLNGSADHDLVAIANQIRTSLLDAGELLGFQVPCCVAPANNTLGVAPSCWQDAERVKQFVALNSTAVRVFASNDAMEGYLGAEDYGWHDEIQVVALAAVVDRDPRNTDQWGYILRANSTDIPWTGTTLNTLTTDYSKSTFFQYYNHHVSCTNLAQTFADRTRHATQCAVQIVAHLDSPSFLLLILLA